MAYFISPISFGLGDLIVSLPAIQALIDSGQDTYLITRSTLQQELAPRINGLSGIIAEEQFAQHSLTSVDKYINMREHPLQKNLWWGSAQFDRQYPGFLINDLLKIICQDLGINADFDQLKQLKAYRQEKIKDAVAFVPGSDGNFKCWPKQDWLSLATLFSSQGMQVLLIGKPEFSQAVKELVPYLNWLPTPDLTDAVDVLSSVKAVVAVDTGLMHLAVHQGIPTIGIYRSHPIYRRNYANSFHITARPCDARCIDKSQSLTNNLITDMTGLKYQSWECQADPDQFCMSSISAQSVFAAAQSKPDLFLKTQNDALSAGYQS